MQSFKRFVSSHLYDESAFRYLYILSLFFSSICFIELPSQIATGIFMVWSVFILSNNLLNKKIYKAIHYSGLLITFLISGLLTTLLHANDNLPVNLVMMYHVVICFFVFYGAYADSNKKKIKLEMHLIFKTIVISTTVLSILGLILAVCFAKIELFGFYLGIRDNRYTGLYTNPNLSAFASVISLVFCHYLMRQDDLKNQDKKALPLWFSISCIVINILTLFLSDSNASLLFMLVYFTTFTFYNLYRRDRGKKLSQIAKHSCLMLLVCVIACVGMFFIRSACQGAMESLINNIHYSSDLSNDLSMDTTTDFTDIGRGHDYEISSGRLDSLKKSMVLYNKNPLMGVGKGNIVEYGNRYLAKGFSFSDLHNGYLTILISTGTIGFLLFMSFACLVAVRLIKKLSELKGNDKGLPILVSAVIAYGVFALFERALLFDITFMVVVFWMILGYTMSVALGDEKQIVRDFKIKDVKDIIKSDKQKIRTVNYIKYSETSN